MKSFYARGVMLALGLFGLAQNAQADNFGTPSLLPIPNRYEAEDTVVRTSFNRRNYQQAENIPSPSDVLIEPDTQPTPMPMPSVVAPGAPCNSPACGGGQSPITNDYQHAMTQSWGDGACSTGDCGTNYSSGSCNRWFASGGGLIMGRANQSNHNFTQNVNDYTTIMTSKDAAQDYAGGFEVSLGRLLGCNGCNAFQFTYWGIYPSDESSSRMASGYPANGIGPVLGSNLNLLGYDNGVNNYTMQQWMTTANGEHELRRSFDFHSVEANFLGNSAAWGLKPNSSNCGCAPRMQYGWLAGFRYLRFAESTTFYTDYDDMVIDNDINEFRYGLTTKNDLYGFQFGGQGNYALNNCWNIYGAGRAGVFNNHIQHRQFISHPNSGNYAQITTGAYAGQDYVIESERDALAVMGQFDLGLRYNWNCRVSLEGGYRVIGIAGVATSDGQISDNFADPRMAAAIKADDALLLHGAYLGGTFRF
jgi:Putative beta barrel porin-7 (BBP7)